MLIAAGARPNIPDIPGLSEVNYYTSDTVMRVDELPESMAILGGGFIAVELGHVFASYGVNVTMYVRSGSLLRQQDADVSSTFTEIFGDRVNLRLNEVPSSITNADGGPDAVTITSGDTANAVSYTHLTLPTICSV